MPTLTRGELNDLLVHIAAANLRYRAALIESPKDVIERQLNIRLPRGLVVKVVQDDPETLHIVLSRVFSHDDGPCDRWPAGTYDGLLDTYTCIAIPSPYGPMGTRVEPTLLTERSQQS